MINEAYECLTRYLATSQNNTIHFYGEGVAAHNFAGIIPNATIHLLDAPDILLCKNDEVIIVEHFRFDSYHRHRKGGSPSVREMERIRRESKRFHDAHKGVMFHDSIDAPSSYADYLNNVRNAFTKHRSQIPAYRDNLIHKGLLKNTEEPKVMFLIEDINPLGNLAVERSNGHRVHTIVLAHCRPFLDLFKDSVEVDYVLACSSTDAEKFAWFIDRKELDEYYIHTQDYENMDYVDFTPQVTSFVL